MSELLLGIFVGGASRRMGSPKGLLAAPPRAGLPGETLVERLARAGAAAGLDVALVGAAEPYAALLPGVPRIPDAPPGVGPLGGLAGLLGGAGDRTVITIACDMPHVSSEVLRALAAHPAGAPVVAPRRAPDAPFEPMLARWDAPRVRPALAGALGRGVRSFQQLLAGLDVAVFPVDPAVARALVDWDAPEDVRDDG